MDTNSDDDASCLKNPGWICKWVRLDPELCNCLLIFYQLELPFEKSEIDTMRPLTEDESKTLFTKLANYIVRSFLFLLCARPHPFTGKEPYSPHRPKGRTILLQIA